MPDGEAIMGAFIARCPSPVAGCPFDLSKPHMLEAGGTKGVARNRSARTPGRQEQKRLFRSWCPGVVAFHLHRSRRWVRRPRMSSDFAKQMRQLNRFFEEASH